MSIKKEQEVKTILKAVGKLVGIDDDGLHIKDKKEETVETLSFDDFRIFEGKDLTITVNETVKSKFEDE